MAEYVVSSALETFTIVLAQHPELGRGAMGQEIGKLKTKLESLLQLLSDADARQSSIKDLEQGLARIREVTYKAVDMIEIFSLKLNTTRLHGIGVFDSISSRATIHEVKEIAGETSEMITSLQRWGIKALSEGDRSYRRQRKVRETYFNFDQLQLVGLEIPKQKLSELLLDGNNHYWAVSIFGKGGLGKTTLAKLLYHNSVIRSHFDCFAWVVISKEFLIEDVLVSILIQLTSTSIELWEPTRKEMATEQIGNILQTKRCLIVLDDVWRMDILQLLGTCFPTMTGSKIIVTTRTKAVAICNQGKCYRLNPLDDRSSWQLFHGIAISKRDKKEIKDKMINLGKEFTRNCRGVPLFISLLGGLLSTKHTLEEWEAVLEKMKSKVYLRVIDMLFGLIYNDLPSHLKPCFLYFAQFPEDLEIPAKKLIQMWIADGVVSMMPKERSSWIESIEHVAYSYLTELSERYMILIGEVGSTSKIKTCKMHDIMLDLAKWKAKKENFCDHFHRYDTGKQAPRVSIIKHISFECAQDAYTALGRLSPQIRSLICVLSPSSLRFLQGSPLPSLHIVQRFKFLRVLCLEDFEDVEGKLTENIGDLILLRFLSLKNSNIIELPRSIFYLRCLQTLDLRTSAASLQVPNMMWRLEYLRHLYLHPSYSIKNGGKLKLGHLSNLQTLVNINDMDLDLEDVIQLSSLRKLVIIMRNMQSGFVTTRGHWKIFKFKNNTLSHLQSLGIINMTSKNAELRPLLSRCYAISKMHLEGHITKLSECHQLSVNLAKLVIKRTFLEEDPMATLEKLPRLRVLFLGRESFMGQKLICSQRGFPQLIYLRLHGLHNVKELGIGKEAMRGLLLLDISDCPNLNVIPDKVRYLTTFQNQR
ncbi:hypothetical protein L6164_037182 [Bauhinia variegata]|uniref:Uncharacterized protein n=1 Tax=Bauhinia variegata TaxID=167791 RepID=A0ACB9KJ93_BAUVA|nr:hypothetical protein L6164_037182 [Bauhinia variegata]